MVEDMVLPRFCMSAVQEALSDTPIVVIQGARQVGKSTLAQMVTQDRDALVVTMDDPPSLTMAKDDPIGAVSLYPQGLLVVDEAQRAPELILPIKANVDRDRRPGRFLLTGSADLLKVKGVADSLAGRAQTVEMMPLSQGELAGRTKPEDFVAWLLVGAEGRDFPSLDPQAVLRGGFPEVRNRSANRLRPWFDSYAGRLSDHDARGVANGGYADHLLGMLRFLAAHGQAELVKSHLAKSLGIHESTADSYLRVARTMRLVHQYPAWNRAVPRRLSRRPKVCLLDTGLSAALHGFSPQQALHPGGREYFGALVEQFVALELTKQQAWSAVPYDLFHYREHDGFEVDLILQTRPGDLVAIEIKSTQTPTPKHLSSLKALRERLPERNLTGVLLHAGTFTASMQGWLHVLPISALWQHS